MKKKVRLTESQFISLVGKCVKRALNEDAERKYDNIENDLLERFGVNYAEVTIPEHCLPYFANGDLDCYNDEEIEAMQRFERKWNGKLSHNLSVCDVCIPLDDAEPSFLPYNDVYGWEGDDCYRFALPLK